MSEESRCNVCYNEEVETKKCFYDCSFKYCNTCLAKIIKIKNKKPVFECSHCKRECVYTLNKNITEETLSYNKNFSDFCRNNTDILDEIFEIYENSEPNGTFNFGSVPIEISFQTEDPMVQAETQSDIANILRHIPHIFGATNTTTTQTNVNTPPTHERMFPRPPPLRRTPQQQYFSPRRQTNYFPDNYQRMHESRNYQRRNYFHNMVDDGAFD